MSCAVEPALDVLRETRVGTCTCTCMVGINLVFRPYQFNNLVLGIALSNFFENVKINISLHLARNWIEKCNFFEFI